MKIFGVMKKMFNVRSVSLDMRKELYESVVASTTKYGPEPMVMTMEERHKLDAMEKKVSALYVKCD